MGSVHGVRLLVVDDEPDMEPIVLHAFRRQVKNLGWQIAFARNGAEALDKVRQQGDFDVLVTDINMPVMDGLALLEAVQALDLDMKAIVLSAYGDMLNLRKAMQRGALDFVTKPVDMADLEATVDKTLAVVMQLKRARQSDLARAQAEAGSEAKSRLLADVSHELRTPLNAIILFSELLADELADHNLPDLVSDAHKIRWAGRHLMALISDLLDYSRLEAGRLELNFDTVPLPALVADVAGLLRQAVAERHNDLIVSCNCDVVRTDSVRLRQCLFNILGNANKFTENGTIRLSVERDGTDVHIAVSDTGIGMTAEQLKRVFERFEQTEAGQRYGGTGLGLSITAQLCTLMGGTIEVTSTPGQSTTFTLRLPG